MQALVPWTGSPDMAGEFNIVSTSLVHTVHTPNFLYATVESTTPGATMLKVSFSSGALGPTSTGDFSWTGTPQTLIRSRSDATMTVSVLVNIREKAYSPPCLQGWITCANNCFISQSGIKRPCRMHLHHPHFLPNRLCLGVNLELTWSCYE